MLVSQGVRIDGLLEIQEFLDLHFLLGQVFLKEDAHLFPELWRAGSHTQQGNIASTGMVVAQQAVKEGGFSGTIRPNQGQTVPLIDFKGYAGQGFLILEVLTEILNFNHFGHDVAPFLKSGIFANSHIGQGTNDTTSWQ